MKQQVLDLWRDACAFVRSYPVYSVIAAAGVILFGLWMLRGGR